jgi:hypothetical protein
MDPVHAAASKPTAMPIVIGPRAVRHRPGIVATREIHEWQSAASRKISERKVAPEYFTCTLSPFLLNASVP